MCNLRRLQFLSTLKIFSGGQRGSVQGRVFFAYILKRKNKLTIYLYVHTGKKNTLITQKQPANVALCLHLAVIL